jgi:uncharacterized NAD(P)/FAD-binding protein YdhS
VPASEARCCAVAIVGGGCSGLLTAVQLVRSGFRDRMILVEPRERLGAGLAYSTSFVEHLLNVPAGRMSALTHKPSHFLEWLRAGQWPGASADSFAPRKMYGEYLQDLFRQTIGTRTDVAFIHIRAEAVDSVVDGNGARLALSDGTTIRAKKVVLALGNPASSPTPSLLRRGLEDRWHLSPWFGDTLRVRFPGERVLLLGTGLSAVDSALALKGQETPCEIYMLSRRGALPEVHDLRSVGMPTTLGRHRNVRLLFRDLRAQVRVARRSGLGWRPIVDALRPISNDVWRELPIADRQRFLRHLKTYWEPHRHRLAPEVGARFDGHRARGLKVIAGRLQDVSSCGRANRVRILLRGGGPAVLDVDRIISCTGVHENYADSPRPLIHSLVKNGLARPNDLGIGFRTDRHGALLDAAGSPSSVFFTLGPPLRGELIETTAVPEIRDQAEKLALYLTARQSIGPSPKVADRVHHADWS